MALKTRDFAGSDALLKEALESRPDSVDLRALYTYFLVESGQIKVARDFAMVTLGKHDSKDVYTLCAAAALYYTQARENKTSGPEAAQDRNAKFLRSCETFERALSLDVHCTFAAQGLAIALAENVLAGAGSGSTPADAQARIKNARDALTILTKVRESLNDPSVYVNLGHCHYARDEYERAIENVSRLARDVEGHRADAGPCSMGRHPNASTRIRTPRSCSTLPELGTRRRHGTLASPVSAKP